MAQQGRKAPPRFATSAVAHRISVSRPLLASANLEKKLPPTILAWEDGCFPPILDSGGESSTMAENLERLKQRIPLLEYLQHHNWKACRTGSRQEFVGLCPLHQETHPSFYVNAAKNLFYCHGCGHGGDLIRFVQLFLNLPFHQTVAYLEQELTPTPVSRLLEETRFCIWSPRITAMAGRSSPFWPEPVEELERARQVFCVNGHTFLTEHPW